MITRATWFVAGAAAGAVGATYTRRKVKAVANQLAPVNVARSVAGRARARGQDLVDAVKEGRVAMRAKEDELRAGRDAEAAPARPRRRRSSCCPTSASSTARPAGARAADLARAPGRPPRRRSRR